MRYAVLLMLAASPAWACKGIEVHDAWVREAPPGVEIMAAYADLKNTGSKSRILRSISSPDFSSVELHEMRMSGDEMQMRELSDLRIPARSTVELEPGGIHLMLFNPVKPLRAGDTVRLNLNCGSKPHLQATLPVKQAE